MQELNPTIKAPVVEELWVVFHQRLRAFVGQQVSQPEDAEDIVQDVFLRIHRNLGSLEKADRLESWIFQIARNAVVDYYRAAQRRREFPTGEFDPAALGSVEPEPDLCCTREDLVASLEPFVDRLPEPYREAIRLTELGDLTQKAASKRLGISVSGMKSRVQRARVRIREMLEACCRLEFDQQRRLCCYEPRQPDLCGNGKR
jgi:RNA polymerase sigma-70 factor (ECF subfamily)